MVIFLILPAASTFFLFLALDLVACLRPHLIDFMFHGSGGSDFCSLQKKKKVGALLCMRTTVRAPICVVVNIIVPYIHIYIEEADIDTHIFARI